MAKEQTRALTGPRQLKTMLSEYLGIYVDGVGFPAYKNWLPFTTGACINCSVYSETKIDVNLSLDRLTFFPESIFLQDPGVYVRTASVGADVANDLLVLDIVSVKQLDIPTVAENISTNNFAAAMLGSSDDFNQIIMGNFRLMAQNLNFGTSTNIQSTMMLKDFSSASPFAQDMLWFTRILIPRTSNFDTGYLLGAPASRFVVQGMIGQEEEMPYMMRLKNSYELQEQA
jgi:hypothetical protein